MRILELFSSTGSVGKVAKELGHEVVALDRDMAADIQTDIMDWDYRAAFQPGHFDFIWASPPCTEYSMATRLLQIVYTDGAAHDQVSCHLYHQRRLARSR